jgi:hypothetical protein
MKTQEAEKYYIIMKSSIDTRTRKIFWGQFVASLAWVVQALVHYVLALISACSISFVDLLIFPFDVFGGMCGDNSYNVFMVLFTVLWVPIFATPCMKAMLMLWHAFVFLGLRHVSFSFSLPLLA